MLTLGSILKASVVAGLIAGAIVSGFHTLLIEPVIERAIALEEEHSQAHGAAHAEPVVDRPAQRGPGARVHRLWRHLGSVAGGLAVPHPRLAAGDLDARAVRGGTGRTAGLVGGVVTLLKYPANPPGVGEPDTVGYRQALYLGFIGLSVVGTAMALGLFRLLHRPAEGSVPGRGRWLWVIAGYAIYTAAIYAVLPANPDPVEMPADLVWTFRLIAFAGLVVFWISLAGLFGWFARDRSTVEAGDGQLLHHHR